MKKRSFAAVVLSTVAMTGCQALFVNEGDSPRVKRLKTAGRVFQGEGTAGMSEVSYATQKAGTDAATRVGPHLPDRSGLPTMPAMPGATLP